MAQLYLISPPFIDLPAFAIRLQEVLSACQLAYFQLRLKPIAEAAVRTAIETLQPICQQYNVPFILNDWVELAKEYPVAGVHIGKDDMSLADVRRILGDDKVIGVSCYNSVALAENAVRDTADYVAFGAFYPTTTKEAATPADMNILTKWKRHSTLPCVAIGGITAENLAPLVQQGANYIAVSGAVWGHEAGAVVAINRLQDSFAKHLPSS